MQLLMYFGKEVGQVRQLLFASVSQDSNGGGDNGSTTAAHTGFDLFVTQETDDDALINAVLNDPGHVTLMNGLLKVDGASGDPHARYIPITDWKIRARPALMRAAATTNFLNA